jgi:hypothetical protein
MIDLQIESPMPKPLGLVVWNALKTRLTLSGSMPTPASWGHAPPQDLINQGNTDKVVSC